MKEKIKQEKGVTLLILVITVMVLLILTFTIVINTKTNASTKRLTQLKSDIQNLEQKVSDFYNEYGEIPAEIEYTNIDQIKDLLNEKEKSSESKFYVIDLQAMKGISLNYGRDYEEIKNTNTDNANKYEDVYIINNITHNIFYIRGVDVTKNGVYEKYYTKTNTVQEVPDVDLSIKYDNIDTSKTNPIAATPEDAEIIESDANKGIVIKDKNENEWVWVEVPKDTAFSGLNIDTSKELTTQNYNDIKNKMITYATTYRSSWTDEWHEGCGLTQEEYDILYKKMLKSVYTYGGFWIGRYEAGIEGSITDVSKARTSHSDISIGVSPKAISQKDAIPYNNVYCSEAQALAQEMSPDNNYTSSLMFGIQWDLVCKFLEVKGGLTTANINSDSSSWGIYNNVTKKITSAKAKQSTDNGNSWKSITGTKSASSIVLSTGASEETNKMNIYELAGNEWEFTLEKGIYNDGQCADRGGNYYNSGSSTPVVFRGYRDKTQCGYSISFRSVFYK